ncbi:Hsp20/alpha crystallin family protein [Aestuariibaculum sediminum]|uniref:Hsp20/alpha crystallin family protein n=1 Tax=Aestuariibaculum sediminum TaxID=2770637 RepID=A0A8J6U8G0_9FLAO|nr:Hsp20/alpha crystallin family protein [Aestuariibaculum sediminum]MBD0833160.1 Hsp20/alpha crystallin family protein [Aestuariibaculum sediminum]
MLSQIKEDNKHSHSSYYRRQKDLEIQQKKEKLAKVSELPETKVQETATCYHYELKIPGYIKDDFNFYISGDKLVVTTERIGHGNNQNKNSDSKHYYCYPSALFKRKFDLPDDVRKNEIDVDYKNEILSFDLYKSKA